MTINAAPCYCGSTIPFSDCCGRLFEDPARAETPEQLMRARYSAFVTGNEDFLLATWDRVTRPAALKLDQRFSHWLGLEILGTEAGGPLDTRGSVEFKARYLEQDQLCLMHETSNFQRENGRWYYTDGVCSIERQRLGRNTPCPCGSGKKYKRCCQLRQAG